MEEEQQKLRSRGEILLKLMHTKAGKWLLNKYIEKQQPWIKEYMEIPIPQQKRLLAHGGLLPGDIFINSKTTGIIIGEYINKKEDEHSVLFFNCLTGSCTFRKGNITNRLNEPNYIVRLSDQFPERASVIENLIILCSAITDFKGIRECKFIRQQLKQKFGKCFDKDLDLKELDKYTKVFVDLTQGNIEEEGRYGFLCSRLVLLLYQIALIFAFESMEDKPTDVKIDDVLKDCFGYQPKYCSITEISKLPEKFPYCWIGFTYYEWKTEKKLPEIEELIKYMERS